MHRSQSVLPESSAGDLAGAPEGRGVVSCVVDADPRFYVEVLRWYASAVKIANLQGSELVVNIVGEERSDVAAFLRERQVVVRHIPAFDKRSPHCNKISGALGLSDYAPGGVCVLTDTDVAFFEDPRRIPVPHDQVGMRPVDYANPPIGVMQNIFRVAGIREPPYISVPWQIGSVTPSGNGNGGLYVVPGGILAHVSQSWATWAAWLLDRSELLGDWSFHVDQVAMAVALAAEHIEVFEVDARWNVPTHIGGIPEDFPSPSMIHYHQHVDRANRIALTGVDAVDDLITRANAAAAELWREGFPDMAVWEEQVRTDPGSEPGSLARGKPLRDKRKLVRSILAAVQPTSVLDVGCGDGEATRDLDIENYTGIDLSRQSVNAASLRHPDGVFHVGSLTDHQVRADLTLCLDVLTHEPNGAEYQQLVGELLLATRMALLVSGFERPPESSAPPLCFHEPLSRTIRRHDADVELYLIREEHEISTFLVLKPGTTSSAVSNWAKQNEVRARQRSRYEHTVTRMKVQLSRVARRLHLNESRLLRRFR